MEAFSNVKTIRCSLIAGVLTFALSEILNFINLGGLNNPIAYSLLKIVIFLTLFCLLYLDRSNELSALGRVIETLIMEIRRIKEDY